MRRGASIYLLMLLATLAWLPGAQAQRLPGAVLGSFELEEMPMDTAFRMWSAQAGVPLVIDWAKLEEEGIDVERPITIALRNVPAEMALRLLMDYATADAFNTLVLEVHPGFVEVITKNQALRRSFVRVYDVRDLLMEIPSFTDAPSFDLRAALSNTNSGGGGSGGASGGGGEGGLFGEENAQEERPMSRRQRGEQLAQLIRSVIEPDIWQENGGEYASIRYFDGRLIIRAPQYVHGLVRSKL